MGLRQRAETKDWIDFRRREFLIRCCQGASAALVPVGLRGLAFPSILDSRNIPPQGDVDFHLHPHYRAQTPLDAALQKTQAGLDAFVTEPYQDRIARFLAQWSASLLHSAQDMRAVEEILSSDFSAFSLRPVLSRLVRSGGALEIRQNKFGAVTAIGREVFLPELRSSMSSFSKLGTAEFQVVSIDLVPAPVKAVGKDAPGTAGANAGAAEIQPLPAGLRTRVLYQLLGSGPEFYREQRVGQWELEWEVLSSSSSASGELRLRNCFFRPRG